MTDKEANVYIVDVGASMGQRRHGRKETDLEWAMSYVWDKITSAVATDRKTLLQGVIALRSDTTKNDLQGEDAYDKIHLVTELSQILLPQLKEIEETMKPSSTDKGDGISAIVLAVSMIAKTCKHLKYKKSITLVTNGRGSFDTDGLDEITKKIRADGIQLVVLGADFDDAEFGFKEEDKPPRKQKNEAALKTFVEQSGGAFATLAEAVAELGTPRVKETRPVPSYRGRLTLGDPVEHADTAMVIDVERYPRTMIRRPQTASSFVIRQPDGSADAPTATGSTDTVMGGADNVGQSGDDGLVGVRNDIKYQLSQKDSDGQNIGVNREDLARGYEYGRTAVHITESDEHVTKLETNASFEIIGFIPWGNFERYMSMSSSHIIIAQRSNSKAIMALSSFVHALHELESFAIAKLIPKDNKEPAIEVLAPVIEVEYEGLIDVRVPFAEDVRSYRFPALDKVVTVSGKVLKEHRYLPNDKLQSAMDAYVDSMDLSAFGKDDEGQPTEYANMENAYSPVLHRIDQAVRFRAVHPEDPIPPPFDILTRYQNSPSELLEKTRSHLDALVSAADVKKVPPKATGRRKRDAIKPISGLDVTSLLNGGERTRVYINPENAIPTFKQTLDDPPSNENALEDAAAQLAAIIEKRIKDSFADSAYMQALEELSVMRSELIAMEEPGLWNDFVRGLKTKMLGGDLGQGRGDMWYEMRKARLGLCEGKMPKGGEVTAEEGRNFFEDMSLAFR